MAILSFLAVPVLQAAGIERIAVTDTHITVHPAAGTSGNPKVVPVEPYDSYQSARNWTLGTTNNGGSIEFNREASALFTFTTPSGSFDPQLENLTDAIEASKAGHLAIRVKVENFTGTIPARAFITGGGTASAGFTITADGNWQIARLDLSTVTGTTTWAGQRFLRLDFPDATGIAAYENARILIDWIAVTNKPAFSDPITWGRWDRFWDLGYQPAAATADASLPVTFDRFDARVDRYYQKFLLVDGFTPIGDPHWVDDFSGLSYKTVTDHGFAPAGPGAGGGSIIDGVYRMTYTTGTPFDPQLATPDQEIDGNRIRYLHARVRMTGYSGSAATISAGMFSTASGVSLASVPFDPKGGWQTLHFDMNADPDWGGNENVRLDIPNNSGITAADFLNATLEVDWIAATNSATYDGTGDLGGYGIGYDFTIDRLQTRIVPLKGRQGVDSFSPVDFAAIGTDVGKLNFTVNSLVQNTATPRVRWNHDGLTFGINPDRLNAILDQVSTLGSLGINTYCTILNQSNDTLVNDPNWPFIPIRSSDQAPNNLYAFNTGDACGLRYTRAVFEYMAHRMARPGVTPFDNWIYGNEVDAHWFWHNLGSIPQNDFLDYFSVEFRQAALVLAKYHPEFRILLSHTHHWSGQAGTTSQGLPSKTLIDELNNRWKAGGNFDWGVAAHPYPQNLFNPAFWNDTQATYDFNTTKITFNNYEVLPEYFQREELLHNGKQREISLTEQGFHTASDSTGQAIQAAAYACHWHRFKHIPGFKADILHRFADHPAELSFLPGLVDLSGSRKASYQVFAAADTPDWRTAFDTCLPVLPFTSWDDIASLPAWTVLDLPFAEPGHSQGWQVLSGVSGFAANAAGNLVGTANASDPAIENNRFFALERGSERLLVRMKVNSGVRGEIFWGTQDINNYQSVRKFTWTTIADNQFHTYDIDTLDHANWNNRIIRRLRLDPTNVGSGSFELDFILTGKRGDFDSDGVSDAGEGIASQTDSDGDAIPDFADPDPVHAGSAYPGWLAAHPAITGVDRAPDADPDHDGICNGIEFLTGSNPGNAASRALPIVTRNAGGDLVVTFHRDDAAAGFATFVEHGSTLHLAWEQIPVPSGAITGPPVTILEHGTAPDEITVTIPNGGTSKRFARVKIEIPFTP